MRRHPFFALLDNATVRQLGIGAFVALGIVGVYAAFQFVTSDSPSPPSEWLTAEDERQLRQGIDILREEQPGTWVAGCAWEHEVRPPGDVLDVPGDDVENFEARAGSDHPLSFAVDRDRNARGSLEPVSADGYFCLVPPTTD